MAGEGEDSYTANRMRPTATRPYPAEEAANCITHAIGFGLSIAVLSVLTVQASAMADGWRIVSVSIYGTTLILVYLASTLYHSFSLTKIEPIFRIIDHCAIFLLIAGSYTPFMLVPLRGGWGWSLFGVIWGLAALAIGLGIFAPKKLLPLSYAMALLMGWLIVVAIVPALRLIHPAGIWWLLGGGIAYSVGVIFYLYRRLLFHHAIWHGFVLTGSACHFFAILLYLTPVR